MTDAVVTTVVGSLTTVEAGNAENTLVTSVVQQPPADIAQTLVFLGGATAPGADLHFTFPQPTPLATWTIAHNLGKFPSVSVVDSAGTLVVGEVTYTDANNLQVAFNAAFSGTAYLN